MIWISDSIDATTFLATLDDIVFAEIIDLPKAIVIDTSLYDYPKNDQSIRSTKMPYNCKGHAPRMFNRRMMNGRK